jgi:hypothetical protein
MVPIAGLYMKLPGTFAVAFSCVALRAVPVAMVPGAAQVITGVAWLTVICAVAVAAEYVFVSFGTNVAEIVCFPAFSTVPAAGVYENVPATFAVAFNCVPLRAVP